jgi:hypothetical protein
MEIRTMAALGVSLWLAAAAALAAGNEKAETKPTPASGEAKDAKDAKAGADAQGVKSAGPRLRMADAPAKNPGKDRDMRHCLDLPTPKEVIRCSEGK